MVVGSPEFEGCEGIAGWSVGWPVGCLAGFGAVGGEAAFGAFGVGEDWGCGRGVAVCAGAGGGHCCCCYFAWKGEVCLVL